MSCGTTTTVHGVLSLDRKGVGRNYPGEGSQLFFKFQETQSRFSVASIVKMKEFSGPEGGMAFTCEWLPTPMRIANRASLRQKQAVPTYPMTTRTLFRRRLAVSDPVCVR